MKEKSEVLLISCYELGHPSFGLALLSGLLETEGFQSRILDLAVQPLDVEKIQRADFVGISVPMHTALRIGVKAAASIRKINPQAPIIIFGLYAALNADFLLGGPADFVIGGEYEGPLVTLMKDLIRGKDGHGIPGVSCKGERTLPNLKSPWWSKPVRTQMPPLHKYARLEKEEGRFLAGYVEASRGCRHLCRHCPIPPVYNGRFTVIPEEILLEDISAQVAQGAAHITFGDPDFLNGPNHSMKIARVLHRLFPHVTFDMTAKIEHLLKYQDLLCEFAALGCLFIVSAVESLSDTVLHNLHKGHTQVDIIKVIEIVHSAGITLRPSLVPFTPWFMLQDYIDLFDFAERYSLVDAIDPVQYTIRLLVPPGSLLLEEPAMIPYLKPLIQERFIYPWTHPDPRMDLLHTLVTEIVENGEERGEDSERIFYKLKECALAMRDARMTRPHAFSSLLRQDRKRAPRLTEPWFCCAEPMSTQLKVAGIK